MISHPDALEPHLTWELPPVLEDDFGLSLSDRDRLLLLQQQQESGGIGSTLGGGWAPELAAAAAAAASASAAAAAAGSAAGGTASSLPCLGIPAAQLLAFSSVGSRWVQGIILGRQEISYHF